MCYVVDYHLNVHIHTLSIQTRRSSDLESIYHLSIKHPIPRTNTVKCIAITRRCTLFRVFFGKYEHKHPIVKQARTTEAVQLPYIRIGKAACRTLVGAAAVQEAVAQDRKSTRLNSSH